MGGNREELLADSLINKDKYLPRNLQSTCKHGHEYTEINTIIEDNGNRRCRTCVNEQKQRSH
jgi:hypothetical protein